MLAGQSGNFSASLGSAQETSLQKITDILAEAEFILSLKQVVKVSFNSLDETQV